MQVEILSKENHVDDLKTGSNDNFEIKLNQTIKKLIKREGYIKHNIYKRCISTNGGNYLGTLYEIDIKGRTKDGDKELNIFVKNIVELDCVQVFSITDVYNTEIFAYKELSKIFLQLQEDANIPIEERYKMAKVYEESNGEAIILENMARSGYTTCNRMDAVSLEFVETAIKQLAKFHGLSFVIKEKRPEYFDKKLKQLKFPVLFGEEWQKMINSIKESADKNVDDKYKARLDKVYENMKVKYADYNNDETIKICLCHGDYRPNNILVKKDGEKLDVIPVDYQLIHYGCPVFDFLYLIYVGTGREFRKAHIPNLKDLYYGELRKFLRYFDLDVDKVYSRKEFEKVYKEKLDHGLMSALIVLPFILATEDGVPDMTKDQLRFNLDDSYKERLQGVLEDYIEWGFI